MNIYIYLSISPPLNVIFVRFTLIRILSIQINSNDKSGLIYVETICINIDNQFIYIKMSRD